MSIPEFSFSTLNAARASKAYEIRLCINLPKSEKQLNDIFALPNLAELVFDVSDGFGEIPESIKNARRLRYLRIEKLNKKPGEHVLPKVFLELSQLQSLQFIECRNLIWGSDDWSGLSSLIGFYTYASSSEFPKGLFTLPKLSSLDLSSNAYSTLPEEIGHIKTLKSLYINATAERLPRSITQLPLLEKLNLHTDSIPEWVGDFVSDLTSLAIYPGRGVGVLPDKIFDYKNLTYLSLYAAGIKELSPKIGQLSKLETLILSSNDLETLPDEFANLQALRHLTINYNPFAKMPGVIAKLAKLEKLEFKERGTHSSESTRFDKFLKWLEILKPEAPLRNMLADLWDAKPIDPSFITPENIALIFKQGISPLDTNLLNILVTQSPQAYRPLKAGDKLCLAGKTSLKKTDLKNKLKAVEIDIVADFNEQVTHLLMDEKITAVPLFWFGDYNWCLMTDKQLVDFINSSQPDYLVEDAQQNADSNMVANTNAMLFSLDAANVEIALNLLKTGGVPEECKTALFAAYKLAQDAKHRSLAGKLLQQAASPALRDAMQKRVLFHGQKHIGYVTLASYFAVFENTELDMCRFALLFHRLNPQEDILYYLMRRNNSEALREYFPTTIKNNTFRVSLSYQYDGIHHLPLEMFDTKGFTKFNFYTYASNWKMETIFPDDYLKLTHVTDLEIYIGGKSWTEVPPVLKKMTWLTRLKTNLPQEAQNELKTYLPNCTIE